MEVLAAADAQRIHAQLIRFNVYQVYPYPPHQPAQAQPRTGQGSHPPFPILLAACVVPHQTIQHLSLTRILILILVWSVE
jgi:hypothetical protein